MERDTRVWAYCADVPTGQIFASAKDVPDGWVDTPAKIEAEPEKDPDEPSLDDLKARAKELGITYHHSVGIPKLTALIAEAGKPADA